MSFDQPLQSVIAKACPWAAAFCCGNYMVSLYCFAYSLTLRRCEWGLSHWAMTRLSTMTFDFVPKTKTTRVRQSEAEWGGARERGNRLFFFSMMGVGDNWCVRVCRRLLLVSFCLYPFVRAYKIRGMGRDGYSDWYWANINKCHDVWHLRRGLSLTHSLAPSLIPLSISMYLLAFKRLMMPTRAATQAMPGDDDDIDNLRLQFPQRSVFDHLHW